MYPFQVLASHTVWTPGRAARLRLSIDTPSVSTGTGSALVADGDDTAMLRAELLDASGRTISPDDPLGNTTVTFEVDV